MFIHYIQYIMPRYNNSSSSNKSSSKNTSPNKSSSKKTSSNITPSNNTPTTNTPSNNTPTTNTSTNSTPFYNTVKDAIIYSTVFNGTQRIMDNVLGNRKVDVVEKDNYCDKIKEKDNYCDKIKEKYNNDKYNEFLEEEYKKCYN